MSGLVVYVAGPYRAGCGRTVAANIANARRVAIAVWRAGHVALCPHLNTAHFEVDAGLPDRAYLAGDLALLARCQAVVLVPGWRDSRGAVAERAAARRRGIPCFEYPALPALPAAVEGDPPYASTPCGAPGGD